MYDGAGWLLLPEPELAIHIPMTMTPTMTHPRPDFPDPDGDDLAGAIRDSGLADCRFLSAVGSGELGGALVAFCPTLDDSLAAESTFPAELLEMSVEMSETMSPNPPKPFFSSDIQETPKSLWKSMSKSLINRCAAGY